MGHPGLLVSLDTFFFPSRSPSTIRFLTGIFLQLRFSLFSPPGLAFFLSSRCGKNCSLFSYPGWSNLPPLPDCKEEMRFFFLARRTDWLGRSRTLLSFPLPFMQRSFSSSRKLRAIECPLALLWSLSECARVLYSPFSLKLRDRTTFCWGGGSLLLSFLVASSLPQLSLFFLLPWKTGFWWRECIFSCPSLNPFLLLQGSFFFLFPSRQFDSFPR